MSKFQSIWLSLWAAITSYGQKFPGALILNESGINQYTITVPGEGARSHFENRHTVLLRRNLQGPGTITVEGSGTLDLNFEYDDHDEVLKFEGKTITPESAAKMILNPILPSHLQQH